MRKQQFKSQGLEWNWERAFGSRYTKYINVQRKIHEWQLKVRNWEMLLKRYENEFTFFDNPTLEIKVLEWENEFKQKIKATAATTTTASTVKAKKPKQKKKHNCKVKKKSGDNDDQDEATRLLKIVNEYGSKQGQLIIRVRELLLENSKNKIIIFSVYDDTLKSIRKRLQLFGIKSVLLIGNVHTRRYAMSQFKGTCESHVVSRVNSGTNDKKVQLNANMGVENELRTRVILLSTKNTASGADLTEATHVILCDPVPGGTSEAYACERQAVGRAVRQGMSHVSKNEYWNQNQNTTCTITKIIRLVVKNTIEHETHLRNEKLRTDKNRLIKQIEMGDGNSNKNVNKNDSSMRVNHGSNCNCNSCS